MEVKASNRAFIEAANSFAGEYFNGGGIAEGKQCLPLCGFCEKDEDDQRAAVRICLDCNEGTPICDLCIESVHSKIPIFKKHNICSISEFCTNCTESPSNERAASRCSAHPTKDLDLVCETCHSIICSACVSGSHEGHNVRALETAAEKEREAIRSICLQLQTQISRIEALREDALQKAAGYQSSLETVRAKISDGLTSIAQASDSAAESQLKKLEKYEATIQKEYEGHLDALKVKEMTCRSCIQLVERMLEKSGATVEIYETYNDVLNAVRKVLSQSIIMYPPKKTIALSAKSKILYEEFVKDELFKLAFLTTGVPSITLDRGKGMIGSLNSRGNGDTQFNTPTGLVLYPKTEKFPDGLIFVADTVNCRIQVFNATSSVFVKSIPITLSAAASASAAFGYVASAISTCNHVRSVAILNPGVSEFFPDGLLYVVAFDKTVEVYDISTWEHHLSITTNLQAPQCVEVLQPTENYPEGLLFVSDTGSHNVHVFSAASGVFSHHIGVGCGSSVGQMNFPCGLALRLPSGTVKEHQLYVADYNNNRIQVFDAFNGASIRYFGATNGFFSSFAHLQRCYDVLIQEPTDRYPDGVVYISDRKANCVQEYNALTEKHVKAFPHSSGKQPGELAVCVNGQGRNLLFVANMTNQVVDIYLDD